MERENIVDKRVSHDSIETLKELCLMHPNDPTLHTRLAENLFDAGRDVAGLLAAQQAYKVLQGENAAEAGALVQRFGEQITVDDTHPPASKSYLPLANIFNKISLNMHKLRLSEGDVLYRKGEPADIMYLVLEGELAVSTEVDGKHTLINYLYTGNLIGKSIQKKDRVRTSTVAAVEPCLLLRFNDKEIEKALVRFPDLLIQFAKEGMLRQRVELLSAMPLFSHVPLGLRFIVASRSWTTNYKVGDLIKTTGEHMPHAELIVDGVVHLYEEHENEVPIYCGRMGQSELLGIYKLMEKEALGLVIKAETNCVMLCMSFVDIEDLMDVHDSVRQKIIGASSTFSEQMIRTILLQKQATKQKKEEGR